jgi:hypothetical protein
VLRRIEGWRNWPTAGEVGLRHPRKLAQAVRIVAMRLRACGSPWPVSERACRYASPERPRCRSSRRLRATSTGRDRAVSDARGARACASERVWSPEVAGRRRFESAWKRAAGCRSLSSASSKNISIAGGSRRAASSWNAAVVVTRNWLPFRAANAVGVQAVSPGRMADTGVHLEQRVLPEVPGSPLDLFLPVGPSRAAWLRQAALR